MKRHDTFLTLFACSLIGLLASCGAEPQEPSLDATQHQPEYDDVQIPLSCEGVDLEDECVEPMPEAVRLDAEERLGFEEITFDRDAMAIKMRLAPGAELHEKIRPGAPIYRARRDRKPFMAIIESVDRRDREVRIKVRRADFEEVFKEGRVHTTVTITQEMMVPADAVGPTQEMAEMQERMQGLNPIVGFDCTRKLIDEGVFVGTDLLANIELELEQCHFSLTGDATAILQWGPNRTTYFEVSLSAGLELILEAAASVTLGEGQSFVPLEKEKKITTFSSIALPIKGGLSLSIIPELYGGVYFNSNTDIHASAGFEYDASATVGFSWTGGGIGFKDLTKTESNFQQIGPEFSQSGSATFGVYLKPQLTLSILGTLSGNAALKGYAEVTSDGTGEFNSDGEFEGELCYELYAGFTPSVGLDLQIPIIKTKLVDKDWEFKGKEYKLADGCIASDVQLASPNCGRGTECRVDADCIGPGVTSCQIYDCNSSCTCSVSERPGCCSTNEDCDDGVASTLDVCDKSVGLCLNSPITGYCDQDTDCNDNSVLTEDLCIANRCEHRRNTTPNPEVKGPGLQCHIHSDCDDGVDFTVDSCDYNKCSNVVDRTQEPRCETDDDCNDGVVFTEDTCQLNGECRNEYMRPDTVQM